MRDVLVGFIKPDRGNMMMDLERLGSGVRRTFASYPKHPASKSIDLRGQVSFV